MRYLRMRIELGLRTTRPAAPAPRRMSTRAMVPFDGPPSVGSSVDVLGRVALGLPVAGSSWPDVVVVLALESDEVVVVALDSDEVVVVALDSDEVVVVELDSEVVVVDWLDSDEVVVVSVVFLTQKTEWLMTGAWPPTVGRNQVRVRGMPPGW